MNKKTKSRSQKNKNRKHRKTQRGGFAKMSNNKMDNMSAMNMPMMAMPTMAMPMDNQKGGSPASTLVMQDTVNPPVMNDYVTSPRIREPSYDNSLGAIASSGSQMGGGIASDLVMENLTSVPETKMYPESFKVKGDMNSLNLYQTTGGARRKHRSRKHRSHKNKSRKNKSRSHKRRSQRGGGSCGTTERRPQSGGGSCGTTERRPQSGGGSCGTTERRPQSGGASAWLASQYSLGPMNNPEMSASAVGQFSQSMATSRDILMNPPNLGLAGSGSAISPLEGANVRHVGSPL